MKRKMFFYLLIISSSISFSQTIEVLESKLLPLEDNTFALPQFSPDGSKLLFTQNGCKGLWIYNLKSRSLDQINDNAGAGYEPVFSDDGSQVIYRIDEYVHFRKYSMLAVQSLNDKSVEYLTEKTRGLLPAMKLDNDRLLMVSGKQMKTLSIDKMQLSKSLSSAGKTTYIEDQKIVLVVDGEKSVLAPLGEGNYIWPSLSPDQSQLLFTKAGKGSYICDLKGNILTDLGQARAPKWSPDGNWIVYMLDKDDGHTITSSDIWAVYKDGKKQIQLTNSTDIAEMYPVWSPIMDKIAFDTADGKIGYLTITIGE